MEQVCKEEVVDVKIEEGNEVKYVCPVCTKRFVYMFTLGRHMAKQECLGIKVEENENNSAGARGSDRENCINISDSSDDDVGTNYIVFFCNLNKGGEISLTIHRRKDIFFSLQ